jgi:hypothetical protein
MMSTGLIAGGSLAGIIIALLVVFEELGKRLDFSTTAPGGEQSFLVPAILAFGLLVAALLTVALTGKRPVSEEIKNQSYSDEI